MSGSGVRICESSSSESTISDGSPRRDFAGDPSTPTTSPRCTSISPVRSTGQRSWMRPRAVDEVEEHELAHVAARHHAAGEPALRRRPSRRRRAARPPRGRPRSRRGRESSSAQSCGRVVRAVSPRSPSRRARRRRAPPRRASQPVTSSATGGSCDAVHLRSRVGDPRSVDASALPEPLPRASADRSRSGCVSASAPTSSRIRAATPSSSRTRPSRRCSVPMYWWPSDCASRSASSSTLLRPRRERDLPGRVLVAPTDDAPHPCPHRFELDVEASRSTRAARPSSSRSRPSRRCSVPM